MLTALDLLLFCIAIGIMVKGFSKRRSAWRIGRKEQRRGDLVGLFGYLLGNRKILKKRIPGSAHVLVFWGFAVPLAVVVLAHLGFTIPPIQAGILSLFLDILGMAFLTATIYLLVRRIKSTDPRGPKKTLLPLFILLFILVTGFFAEGSRLSIIKPEIQWASPFGSILAAGLPSSPRLMQLMIRIHLFAVFVFMAILPFTFFRHLVVAPLNVYYRRKTPLGRLKDMPLDNGPIGARTVSDFTWKQLLDTEACVSCGRCDENCPAFISGKPLSPRKIIQDILEQMMMPASDGGPGLPAIPILASCVTDDEIWSCTTCMACAAACPLFIEPMDKIIDMRRYWVMGKGLLPDEARPMIRHLEIFGDVQGKGIAHRTDWAFSRDAPVIQECGMDQEVLFWVGCSGAFHPRSQEVSRAMVKILKAAKVGFSILGKHELCCGDPARRLGEEEIFLDLAEKNMQRFQEYNVTKIVTLCPHCYNTLKNEYPGLRGVTGPEVMTGIEVSHAAEFVAGLIQKRRIVPKYPLDKIVAIHDPCYLGRINRVYGQTREMVRAVPEVCMRELARHHEKGLCCGGGGGRMWLHERLGRRMNEIRAEEAFETGIDVLGTACPYCLTMLDDGIKALGQEKVPEVLDIVEIVASSIG